jgi:hypothetical protein
MPPLSTAEARTRCARGPRSRLAGSWAFVLPLLLPSACRPGTGQDLVERERLSVLSWTVPKGATIVASSAVERRGSTGHAVTDISTALSWEQYRRWVEASHQGSYARAGADGTSLCFLRLLAGDEFRVDLQVVASGPPLSLRMTFTAIPD